MLSIKFIKNIVSFFFLFAIQINIFGMSMLAPNNKMVCQNRIAPVSFDVASDVIEIDDDAQYLVTDQDFNEKYEYLGIKFNPGQQSDYVAIWISPILVGAGSALGPAGAAVVGVTAGVIYSGWVISAILKKHKQHGSGGGGGDDDDKDKDKKKKNKTHKHNKKKSGKHHAVQHHKAPPAKSTQKTQLQPAPAPEQQGCGDWTKPDECATDLVHPMPEIETPEYPGCGHKPEFEMPIHTGHSPIVDLQPTATGCGYPVQTAEELQDSLILQAERLGDLSDVEVVFNENNKGHIFKDRPGHLTDTPENRAKIIDLVKDIDNFLLKDARYGKLWYSKILADGTQLWAEVIDQTIRNCGINNIPRQVNAQTGLAEQNIPQK